MRPVIKISKEMIDDANLRSPSVAVNRTKTSSYDTMSGILGEYCFAQWFVGGRALGNSHRPPRSPVGRSVDVAAISGPRGWRNA